MLGDAVCSFNPTYGQGITVAVVQAATLGSLLCARAAVAATKSGVASEGTPGATVAVGRVLDVCSTSDQCPSTSSSTAWLAGLPQEFQAAIHTDVKKAWDLAVGADMKFPSATSNEPFNPSVVERMLAAYVRELIRLAGTDFQVSWGPTAVAFTI